MQEGAASLDRGQLIHCLFRGHTCALYIVLVIQPAYLHLRLRVCRACGRFRSSWNPCGSVQSICERHGARHSANTVLLLSISETIALLGSRAV